MEGMEMVSGSLFPEDPESEGNAHSLDGLMLLGVRYFVCGPRATCRKVHVDLEWSNGVQAAGNMDKDGWIEVDVLATYQLFAQAGASRAIELANRMKAMLEPRSDGTASDDGLNTGMYL